jgi:hypothetical protein
VVAALTADGDTLRRDESRAPPAWFSVAPKLTRKISDDCAPADESLGEVPVYFFSGARSDEVKVMPQWPLPPSVLQCIERSARAAEIPPNQSFSLAVTLDPPWFAQGLAVARRAGAECLPPSRAGERIEPTRILLTATSDRAQIVTPPGPPELARCLERAFWFVRLPAGTVRPLYLMPNRPKTVDTKPLTAENREAAR